MASKPDDVPVEELKKIQVNDDDEDVTPGYKAPAKVDLETIKNMDADDESLAKYKADLLKGSEDQLDEGGANVLVKSLSILVEGRDDIVLDLTGNLSSLKHLKLKEGTDYKLKIDFRVQREIVSGLKFSNVIKRKSIPVDKSNYMVGSYGPKKEAQSFTTTSETTPKGMIARGSYEAQSKFVDDDKVVYLEWKWFFDVAKDW